MGISVDSTGWLFYPLIPGLLEMFVFNWSGRKTGVPGEKPSEQEQEPTPNSTHIQRQVQESKLGHISGR